MVFNISLKQTSTDMHYVLLAVIYYASGIQDTNTHVSSISNFLDFCTKPNRLLYAWFYPLVGADVLLWRLDHNIWLTIQITVFVNSLFHLLNLPKQLIFYLYYFIPPIEVPYSIHGGLCALLGELSPDFIEPFSHLDRPCSPLGGQSSTHWGHFFLTKSFHLFLNGFVVLLKSLKLLFEGLIFLPWTSNLMLKSFFLHCNCSFLSFESLNLFSEGFVLLLKGLLHLKVLCFLWRVPMLLLKDFFLFPNDFVLSLHTLIVLTTGFVFHMKSSVLLRKVLILFLKGLILLPECLVKLCHVKGYGRWGQQR